MARQVIGKLKADQAKAAKRKGHYSDGKGLYLRVSSTGAKSWVFRYRVEGQLREMGLGGFDPNDESTVTLAEARDKATAIRKDLRAFREGEAALDPLAAKRAAKTARLVEAAKAMTFRQCAEACIEAKSHEWK